MRFVQNIVMKFQKLFVFDGNVIMTNLKFVVDFAKISARTKSQTPISAPAEHFWSDWRQTMAALSDFNKTPGAI